MSILSDLQGPADLRGMSEAQLTQLAAEIRDTIIRTVAETGGHLGSSLGVVELTIALHRLLESPRDRIVWDTGHQAYPHKLLTGRLARFSTLRSLDGVGGFPRRSESPHDVFDGGHAGTGLSIAEGLAEARDLRHGMERIAVVVGDAALMSGLSLEALNDIGQRQTQMLIVVNDNEMSISPTVGAFSKYLSQIKLSSAWRQSKSAYDRTVERVPVLGPHILELSKRLRGVGRAVRPARSAVRGPRVDVHRRRAWARPPGIGRNARRRARAARADDRARSHAEGPRLPASDRGPGQLPWRRVAADGARTAGGCVRRLEGEGRRPGGGQQGDRSGPDVDADQIDGRRRCGPDAGARGTEEAPELHGRVRGGADRACPDRPPHRRDHRRHADRDRDVEIRRGVPGSCVRRRDRRAARRHAGDWARDGRHAPRRGPLFHVPPAGVRPDRPRRLPERPAGPARRRPFRPRGRRRHEPPGHVRIAGPATAAEPGDRFAEGRAGTALAPADGAGAGSTVRPALPARRGIRTRARGAGRARGRAGRDLA